MIFLNEDTPLAYRIYFAKLIQTADDFLFYIEGNMCVMVFYYKLYNEF